MTADTWVVRVRVARMCWTSPVMTGREAEDYREGLRAQVLAAGDGTGMVDFRALGGRQVSVRAREVVAVEAAPWTERERRDDATADSPGTAFLRSLRDTVALDAAIARHPAGSRQPIVR